MQVDPKEAQTAALKREVQLLRAENAYLRDALTASGASNTVSQISAASGVRPAAPVNSVGASSLGQPTKQLTAEASLYACHLHPIAE